MLPQPTPTTAKEQTHNEKAKRQNKVRRRRPLESRDSTAQTHCTRALPFPCEHKLLLLVLNERDPRSRLNNLSVRESDSQTQWHQTSSEQDNTHNWPKTTEGTHPRQYRSTAHTNGTHKPRFRHGDDDAYQRPGPQGPTSTEFLL